MSRFSLSQVEELALKCEGVNETQRDIEEFRLRTSAAIEHRLVRHAGIILYAGIIYYNIMRGYRTQRLQCHRPSNVELS